MSISLFIAKGCGVSMLTAALLQSVTDKLRGIIPCLVAVRMLPKLPWWTVARKESLQGAGCIRGFVWINIVEMPGEACVGLLCLGSGGCYSVTQSCLTLHNPMDCSMPGFLVLHHLPEFAYIHVH